MLLPQYYRTYYRGLHTCYMLHVTFLLFYCSTTYYRTTAGSYLLSASRQALPKELESLCGACDSLFQDLAAAHAAVRDAQSKLEQGKHWFQVAAKSICKVLKNEGASLILKRNTEIMEKDVRVTEGSET